MKRMLAGLILLPLSSFAMDGDYVRTMIHPKDQDERALWKKYCALSMTFLRDGQSKQHSATVCLLNKKVGENFVMSNKDNTVWFQYAVRCSLLKMENNVADIEYTVALGESAQVPNKMTIPMNGRDSADLKFDNDNCPVTLTLAVYPQD